MQAERYIAAADLGSSKIALSVAKIEGDDIQVIYYKETPSDGIRNSYVFNPKRAAAPLRNAIREAEEELNIKILQVVVGLPRYDVRQEIASARMERSFPSTGTAPAEISAALQAKGANGLEKWESYVLGLDPTDPTAKLRLTASSKDATTVTITGVIDTTKFPEPTGTTVKFRLAKRNGDEWTNLATGSETPSFDCLLEDVVGEVLAIFADIVTE